MCNSDRESLVRKKDPNITESVSMNLPHDDQEMRDLQAVLPGPDKHSRPHPPKTTAIFEAFTATNQKICCCMIFQITTTTKSKKT
jgi:hypothetical protein